MFRVALTNSKSGMKWRNLRTSGCVKTLSPLSKHPPFHQVHKLFSCTVSVYSLSHCLTNLCLAGDMTFWEETPCYQASFEETRDVTPCYQTSFEETGDVTPCCHTSFEETPCYQVFEETSNVTPFNSSPTNFPEAPVKKRKISRGSLGDKIHGRQLDF